VSLTLWQAVALVPYIRVLMSTLTCVRRARVLLAFIGVVACVTACGSDESPPPGVSSEIPSDSGPNTPTDGPFMVPIGSPCTEGETQTCKVLLPAHGSIHPCFVGRQICIGSKWGPCEELPEAGAPADGSAVN